MNGPEFDDTSRPLKPVTWHESVAHIVAILALAAILTSPCWGLALFAWVTK